MADNAWYESLRDILIVLSAVALLTTTTFVALVAWQIYRLFREFREEASPILMALQDTAETVRNTSDFVGSHLVNPTAQAVGEVADSTGIWRLVQRLKGRGGAPRAQSRGESHDVAVDGGVS